MGNNASSTAVETLPGYNATSQQYPFNSNLYDNDVDEQDQSRLGPFGEHLFNGHPQPTQQQQQLPPTRSSGRSADLLHGFQPQPPHPALQRNNHSFEDPTWTLHSRMASNTQQPPNTVRRQPQKSRAKPPGVVTDNSSDYGSFDSDSDKISSMNPKAAADEVITELDKLLGAPSNPKNNRKSSHSGHNSRNSTHQDSIDGLEREAFAKPEPRSISRLKQSSIDKKSDKLQNASGKLPSYDDLEQQLIDSIETEFTRT